MRLKFETSMVRRGSTVRVRQRASLFKPFPGALLRSGRELWPPLWPPSASTRPLRGRTHPCRRQRLPGPPRAVFGPGGPHETKGRRGSCRYRRRLSAPAARLGLTPPERMNRGRRGTAGLVLACCRPSRSSSSPGRAEGRLLRKGAGRRRDMPQPRGSDRQSRHAARAQGRGVGGPPRLRRVGRALSSGGTAWRSSTTRSKQRPGHVRPSSAASPVLARRAMVALDGVEQALRHRRRSLASYVARHPTGDVSAVDFDPLASRLARARPKPSGREASSKPAAPALTARGSKLCNRAVETGGSSLKPLLWMGVAASAATVTAGVVAYAATSDQGGVISGCYQKSTGALRVIDPGAGESCRSQEVAISWNQRGREGRSGSPSAVLRGRPVPQEAGAPTWSASGLQRLDKASPSCWRTSARLP